MLREARVAAGMSLSDVARSGAITAAGLSLVERGKRHPQFDTVVALARAYKVNILIRRDGEVEVLP